MRRRRRAIWWTPALVWALWIVAPGPAWPGLRADEAAPAPESPADPPGSTEPARAPWEERSDEQIERMPGRDDPEEFYKKPPRKPRQRTKMYA